MAEAKGEVRGIVEEVVAEEDLTSSCFVCGATEKLLRCSGCKEATYCSKEHQLSDWKSHKGYCVSIRRERKAAERAAAAPPKEPTPLDKSKERRLEKLAEEMEQMVEEGGGLAPRPLRFLPEEQCSMCGNHARGPSFDYVHALNNMAGKHRIDLPLDEESDIEDYLGYGDSWEDVADKLQGKYLVLANGLKPQPGCKVKRCEGPLGIGMRLYGRVLVGTAEGEEVTVDVEEAESFVHTFDKDVRVSETVMLHAGSRLDAFGCLHGPLNYHGQAFSSYGGIHYSGCAFVQDGKSGDKKENPYYKETCIASLVGESASGE